MMDKRNKNERIKSFGPLVDVRSKLLVLGTMPGEESLSKQMYYANGKNHFWDFLYRILQDGYSPYEPFDCSVSRDDRYSLLLSNGIALWDIISSCTREGSSDKKIRDAEYNDVESLVKTFGIKMIICNGQEAYRYLKKSGQLKALDSEITVVNSTSSLNPNNTFHVFKEWMHFIKPSL
jgi:hypoxanthine-DNA glycosylase